MASLTVPLPAGVQPRTARQQQNAANEAVKILRGPQSLWPVDTGRSKRAWRVIGSGRTARVFNPVRYASFVEARGGKDTGPYPARRTLERHVGRIRRAMGSAHEVRAGSTRPGIVAAAQRRAALEQEAGLYDIYLALANRQNRRGRGPLRRPASLRALERRIRERATQ